MNADQVLWPAVLKLHGTDELVWLPDHAEWQQASHLRSLRLTPQDCLVDSEGKIFRIDAGRQLVAGSERLDLTEVLQLVRLHAAQDGACCAAKLAAPSIAAAIALVSG
ncbi:MAG TPA: DUF4144 family protein [Methylophilaceae bacterium]|jgi:hypothetical protein